MKLDKLLKRLQKKIETQDPKRVKVWDGGVTSYFSTGERVHTYIVSVVLK